MTPEDENMIRRWPFAGDAPAKPIKLSLESSNQSRQMTEFCDRLTSMHPDIRVKKDSDLPVQKPAIITGAHDNVAYQAIPSGKVLSSFLQALDTRLPRGDTLPADVESLLKRVDLPVILTVYIAAHCPHCPEVLRQMQALAAASAKIRLRIVDAGTFPDIAASDDVRSVPTVILDDRFRFSGSIDLKELLTICIRRNPADLSSASLRQLIEDGRAERVSAMMIDSGQVFAGLTDLITHPRWSVRLGAMVTVEYLVEKAPALANELADLLWQDFNQFSDQVQGDVVHVLGEINSPVNRERLLCIASGAYDETVKEAAEEVLGVL